MGFVSYSRISPAALGSFWAASSAGGTGLYADELAAESVEVLDVLFVHANRGDLAVDQVRLGECDFLLALGGNGHAVPDTVEFLGVQGVDDALPFGGLPHDLDAKAFAHFLGGVYVKTDEFGVVVAKAHGRKCVVKADDQLAGILHTFPGTVGGVGSHCAKTQCHNEKSSHKTFHSINLMFFKN